MTQSKKEMKEKLQFLQELVHSHSIKFYDLVSGKEFASQDVKSIQIASDTIEIGLCDKEIQLIVDDEILSCFTGKELELIQSEVQMEFPFAVVTIKKGEEHTVVTRGLSYFEKDVVTYNIRRVFEETIANLD
ncbi:MAG: hypothetical protein CSA81_05335 [Acidobacteria bacterium]|nr:MAG: hypothetical protein CSA81_05335 [Acidobacteriota bacterium]PIE90989.1 MAG: hypothetical protein CR997_03775 [Acidobacteriota bacterium]